MHIKCGKEEIKNEYEKQAQLLLYTPVVAGAGGGWCYCYRLSPSSIDGGWNIDWLFWNDNFMSNSWLANLCPLSLSHNQDRAARHRIKYRIVSNYHYQVSATSKIRDTVLVPVSEGLSIFASILDTVMNTHIHNIQLRYHNLQNF